MTMPDNNSYFAESIIMFGPISEPIIIFKTLTIYKLQLL